MSEHVIAIHIFLARYLRFHDRFQVAPNCIFAHDKSLETSIKESGTKYKGNLLQQTIENIINKYKLGKKNYVTWENGAIGGLSLSLFGGVFSRSNDLVKQLSSLKILPGAQGQFMNDEYIDQYKEQKNTGFELCSFVLVSFTLFKHSAQLTCVKFR